MSEFKIDNLKVLGAAVFGDNAKQANIGGSDDFSHREDLVDLVSDLGKLRIQMQAQGSTECDHRGEIEAVAAAEDAAKEGNRHAALGALSKVGNWVLDVATKVGVPLAVAALKEALQMPTA